MTDQAYHENETQDREKERWVAYQKEGLAPDKIISREKSWAQASLKTALSSWTFCVLGTIFGAIITVSCGGVLYLLRDSSTAWVCCGLGILLGLAPLALFGKRARRKPILYKSLSWLLAEQQLNGTKK